MPGPDSFDIKRALGTHHTGPARETRTLDAYVKLARCTTTVDAALAAGLEGSGLTTAQLGVLEALLHLGQLSQKDLGRKVLRSGGSITAMVDHLEKRKLVRRERSSEDRRVVLVQLTPAGRRLISRVFPEHLERMVEVFSALTAAEQDELGRLCRKLGLSGG